MLASSTSVCGRRHLGHGVARDDGLELQMERQLGGIKLDGVRAELFKQYSPKTKGKRMRKVINTTQTISFPMYTLGDRVVQAHTHTHAPWQILN